MKKCPLCTAAIPDDVVIAPGVAFCGACGRNTAEVYRSPSLPAGAAPYQDAAPTEPATAEQQAGFPPPMAGQTAYGQQPPPGQNPQFGTPPPVIGQAPSFGQQPQQAPGPQFGTPPPVVGQPGQYGGQSYGGQQPFNPQQQGAGYPPSQYPSGQPYPQQSAPPGLNWGAFFVPFAWGPANRVMIGLVSLTGLIPCFWLIYLGTSIYLLIKGNELAWTSGRPWQSVDEFRAVQKQWALGGAIGFAIILFLYFIYISMFMMHRGGGYYPRYY